MIENLFLSTNYTLLSFITYITCLQINLVTSYAICRNVSITVFEYVLGQAIIYMYNKEDLTKIKV